MDYDASQCPNVIDVVIRLTSCLVDTTSRCKSGWCSDLCGLIVRVHTSLIDEMAWWSWLCLFDVDIMSTGTIGKIKFQDGRYYCI